MNCKAKELFTVDSCNLVGNVDNDQDDDAGGGYFCPFCSNFEILDWIRR